MGRCKVGRGRTRSSSHLACTRRRLLGEEEPSQRVSRPPCRWQEAGRGPEGPLTGPGAHAHLGEPKGRTVRKRDCRPGKRLETIGPWATRVETLATSEHLAEGFQRPTGTRRSPPVGSDPSKRVGKLSGQPPAPERERPPVPLSSREAEATGEDRPPIATKATSTVSEGTPRPRDTQARHEPGVSRSASDPPCPRPPVPPKQSRGGARSAVCSRNYTPPTGPLRRRRGAGPDPRARRTRGPAPTLHRRGSRFCQDPSPGPTGAGNPPVRVETLPDRPRDTSPPARAEARGGQGRRRQRTVTGR
jgi:hypothetical protein